MNRSELLNGGAFCRTARHSGANTATAAGTGDATAVTGLYVDRTQTDAGPFLSAKLVINWSATLAATKTLSLAAQFKDATDASGTGVANYGTAIAAAVVATGPAGGGTVTGTTEIDVDLSHAREFFTADITPDLSATGTDTVAWSASYVLFGAKSQPLTKAIASV